MAVTPVYELPLAMAEGAARDVFKVARRVPADKWEWKPLDAGRSVLDLCRECAYCPLWAVAFVKDASGVPDPTEGQDYETAIAAMTTVDACEEFFLKNWQPYRAAVLAFPVERLHEQVTIPYGTFPYYQVLFYPLWNFQYHEGQINYIQTLYGDKEM